MSAAGLQGAEPVLVAAPMRMEARALRRGAPGLKVTLTGVGPSRSRRAARRLRNEPAAALAVAGLCGALDDGLRPGDVFVASELRGGDTGAVAVEFEALLVALHGAGVAAASGPLVSCDHAVHGEERRELARSGARAVDMESAWLAAGAAGRPLAVLRVVLDSSEQELWRPAAIPRMVRALRTLRRAAPALADWARVAREVCEARPGANTC